MTGKELLLVLVGAATAAGAGGVAAATLLNQPPVESGEDAAVLERLDRLSASLDDTNSILQQSRDEIGGLRGRIEAVELGLHGAAAPSASSTESGRRRVDVSRHGAVAGEVEDGDVLELGSAFDDATQARVQEALKGLASGLQTGGGSPRLGHLFRDADGRIAGLSGALEGLQRSFELRALPEDERWDKAREEVGLNDVQVDEIQAALDERDQAIDESMVIERDEEDGASRISVRRMDVAKTRAANEAYKKRIDNVLNDEQKKAWKEKGYENAFGRGAMGTATVISIGSINTRSDDAE